MSDTSSLSQLARFVGQSTLAAGDAGDRLWMANAMTALALKPRRSVADLLGVVLALSARTRRMMLPHVGIDLDVFTPDGGRAIRMSLPDRF